MSEPTSLPPQLQEQISRLQQLQQTMRVIVTQKQQLELQLSETERALAELEKMNDDAVIYKSVGSLLIKASRSTVLKELNEQKDLINTRVTVLARQEERTRKKLIELQQKIQRRLRPPTASK